MLDLVQDNVHHKLWSAFLVCLMLSPRGKKARCHCDQLNKHNYLACPHPPSLVLLPFPFTHRLCAVTWLWAVLKLCGRGWECNERSGVSVYITVVMKISWDQSLCHDMFCGFVDFFFFVVFGLVGLVFLKQIISQEFYNPNDLEFWEDFSHMRNHDLDFENGARWGLQLSPLIP